VPVAASLVTFMLLAMPWYVLATARPHLAALASAMAIVHPSALVDPSASLGRNVHVGPFTVLEAGATLGDNVVVGASAYVAGCCTIEPDCRIDVGAVLGGNAQMKGATGPGGRFLIGAGSIIREHVTIHRASRDDGCTRIGARAFLLAISHVAHDCALGDDVTPANGALLAGHVTIGDRVFVSGNSVVHQFVRIGRLAMIGGGSRVAEDVLPFTTVVNDSEVYSLNSVGLRRAGFTPYERLLLKRVFRTIYRSGLNLSRAVETLRPSAGVPLVAELLDFIGASTRGLCAAGPRGRRLRKGGGADADQADADKPASNPDKDAPRSRRPEAAGHAPAATRLGRPGPSTQR
jgi:UDP-N-acetylglucosamine acyltransferase